MTVRRRRWWTTGGLMVFALMVFGLGRFLAGQGLDKADQWASVGSLFLTFTALVVAVYSVVRDHRKAPAERESPTADGTVRNTVSGATRADGPVLMGRDMQRIGMAGAPAGAPADPVGASDPVPPGAGDVHNRVDGGDFHGPLIMGRDMRDITLPPPAPGPRRPGDSEAGR